MVDGKYPWQLVLWGAGEMTRRVMQHIGESVVSAIIDTDGKKIGGKYLGKQIISLSEYQKKYANEYILITPMYWREIVNLLKEKGLNKFFLLADCPSEFSEISARNILHDRICREMKKEKKICIYGSTLYALVLNEWAKECLGRYVPIVLPEKMRESFKDDLKNSFDEMVFYEASCLETGIADSVMVADGWEMECLAKQWPKIKFIDAYDITNREKSYYSPRMASLKNIHRGDTCFIIGLGPSLRTEDLDVLEHHKAISFSMNTITKAFDKTKWRPTYYVISDPRDCSDEFLARLEEIPKRYAFIADKVEVMRNSEGTEKTVPFHALCNMSSKVGAVFSEEAERYLGYGATVTYFCLQIAAYMGFKNIYLLGIDGYNHKVENHGYGHFYKEESVSSFAYTDQVYCGYEEAKKYGEAHGIKIINATRGGYINIFDRIDFDSLF